MRYQLDESCPPTLSQGLRASAVDAATSRELGLLGARDEVQLARAHADHRVLVTLDEDFIVLHKKGRVHSGVVYCRKGRYSWAEVIERLALIRDVYRRDELAGKLEYL